MAVLRKLGRILRFTLKWALVVLIAVAGLGVLYQQIGLMKDAKRFPPPGELVSIGDHKLHLYCMGEEGAAPTIILDGGATFIAVGWQWVMDDLASTTRVCAYDRSGIGWSEEGRHPYDGPQMVSELHALVKAAGINTPFVYVGHSLGGDLGRIYYDHYPEDLAGLIMIEPGDPEIFLQEVGAEKGEEIVRTEGVRPCGARCLMASTAVHLGVVRIMLGQVDILDDPKFPPDAADAYKARMSRAVNVRQPMSMGRYVTRIMYQTRDNKSLGDLPAMVIYSTGFGSLLGSNLSEETRKEDLIKNVAAWQRTTATSTNDMGVRAIEGANHLAIIGYQEYAEQVADLTREMFDFIEEEGAGS